MNEKDAYKLYTMMKESMGDDVLLRELVKSLNTDEFISNIEYIARMHGFLENEEKDDSESLSEIYGECD